MTRTPRRMRLIKERREEELETTLRRMDAAEYVIDPAAGSVIDPAFPIRDTKHANEMLRQFLSKTRHSTPA